MDLNSNITNEQTTFIKQMSSSLLQNLSQYNPLFAELLSAIQTQSLSGVPINPYEKLKYDLFGKGYVFKTINDIKSPDTFNLEDLTEKINQIADQCTQSSLSAVSAFSIKAQEQTSEPLSFNLLENDFIDINLARKNIEISEIVRSITIEQIKKEPIEIAKKLINHFVEINK